MHVNVIYTVISLLQQFEENARLIYVHTTLLHFSGGTRSGMCTKGGNYHLAEGCVLLFGGTGELVALLDTLGCSGMPSLASVDFQASVVSLDIEIRSDVEFLVRACMGMR